MTAPTPTPSELEMAKELEKYLAEMMTVRYQIPTVQQLSMFLAAHRADWDETKIANAGAAGLARALLEDIGHGEMSPGPCADALEMVRSLRIRIADPAVVHAAELETELKHIQEMAAEDIRMGDASGAIWQIEANARVLLATLDAERKAQVTL